MYLVPMNLLGAGLPQTSWFVKTKTKAVSVKLNIAKHNKMPVYSVSGANRY